MPSECRLRRCLALLPSLEALSCRTEAREKRKGAANGSYSPCFVLPTAVLASLLIGKAGAEKPPQLLPTRDVDIIYEVTLPSQPRIRERVRYLAAELLERVDGPHKSTTIFDCRTHRDHHPFVGKPYLSQVGYAAAAARARARGHAQARQRISRCGIALRRDSGRFVGREQRLARSHVLVRTRILPSPIGSRMTAVVLSVESNVSPPLAEGLIPSASRPTKGSPA